MNSKKSLVIILTFLLTFSFVTGLFTPAKAETTWTNITLPYTITESGNYRITSAWNGSGIALAVNVSNVVFDGQNYLINMSRTEGDNGVRINNGSQNVLLQNLKVRNAYVGVHATSQNFTVQNSSLTLNYVGLFANCSNNFDVLTSNLTLNIGINFFAKNSSYFSVENCNLNNAALAGAIATYSDNFQFINCNINNNIVAGMLTRYSQNFTVADCEIKNNRAIGFLSGKADNFTFAGNNLTNSSIGAVIANSNSYELLDSTISNNSLALINVNGTSLTIDNCAVSNNSIGGIISQSSHFSIHNSTYQNNTMSLTIEEASNFTIADSTVKNATEGLIMYDSGNFTMTKVALMDSMINGEIYNSGNATITDCTFNSGVIGFAALYSNITIQQSSFVNNSVYGLYAIMDSNMTLSNSLLQGNGNGIDTDFIYSSYGGALMSLESNCTVVNNVFQDNHDALIWAAFDADANNTVTYTSNVFTNNTYTIFIDYELPSDFSNQQFYFFNNLVNDTAYIDPLCLSGDFSGTYLPFNSTVFHFNTTMQEGARPYSGGRMIGGNYWAFPNGTGPSQTGADANHDGFIDTTFDLFGNGIIIDYLPYSSGYISNFTYIAGTSQTLVANQTSSPIVVQYKDFFGNITSGVTLNLSTNSTTAKFYSDPNGTTQISTLTIPAGSSTGSFYFKDSQAGTPTITVSAQTVTPATTNFTIKPHAETVDHIVISANATTIAAGQTANFTTTAYDVYGNAWNVSASYTVDGQAFSGTALTGEIPGAYAVVSTYGDKTDTATLIVTPGAIERYVVLVPNSATVGTPFAIRVVALDSMGNIVTGFTGTVALTANGTTVNPSTSGSFTAGQWLGTVTIAQAGSFKITATDGNGHSGTSSAFTVSEASNTPTPTPTTNPASTIAAIKDDGSTVNLQISGNITSTQITNLSIATNQSSGKTIVSFTVTGPSGGSGFSNMTIPKNSVSQGTTPIVLIDGQQAANQGYVEDSQNFYVWFTTSFSTHQVEVQFTGQAPTEPQSTIWYVIIIIAAVAIVAAALAVYSKRKRK